MTHRVDIGIACNQTQTSRWWGAVMGRLLQEQQRGIQIGQILAIGSALPDFNKNESVGYNIAPVEDPRRNARTDANRCYAVSRFMGGNAAQDWQADWIMWLDDDTVPPDGFISKLLAHEKPFVAGLYFNTNEPYNPIAYYRARDHIGYDALWDYPHGALMQVDSVGMGCTLVHREVYEAIRREHEVFVRPNGSLFPVHRSQVYNLNIPQLAHRPPSDEVFVSNGWACTRVTPPGPDDNRLFPFYSMEYGRTEDHHFCELAEAAGYKPFVDTTILCEHVKAKPTGYKDYKDYLNAKKNLNPRG